MRVEAGTNAHHMVEASFKAFARALRAAVSLDAVRDRHPVDEGGAVSDVRIAILDYGMGNLRSVEKALEHVGAQATVTNDHEQIRARRRAIVLPGVGAFPKAMAVVRELGLDELIAERLDRAACRCSASASACSCCSSASHASSAGPAGWACWRARSSRSTRPG